MRPPHELGPETGRAGDDCGTLGSLSAPVQAWFRTRFEAPTEPQRLGWPPLARGEDTLYEETAWRLLRRYGVVFRDLLAREWLPGAWRTIHRALRRLEARGQVRGGRFVAGWVGEQFALSEAVTMLRQTRDGASRSVELQVSACDPLNLAGILTPGGRVPAAPDRRLLLRDGLPVAVLEAGRTTELGVSIE